MSGRRFDRSRLVVRPLAERRHDLDLSAVLELRPTADVPPNLRLTAERIRAARAAGAAVVLFMGAHVLRRGVQLYLIDLLERGWLSCVAMNGAGVIHDWELALVGATTESVARYVADGQFGLWRETGAINDVVAQAARGDEGLGAAVGRAILEGPFPHREVSVLAAAARVGVPVTVHVGVGYDIVHEHPNCDGAALGACSYRDFLELAAVMERLEGGVVMNFGSAVMAPEVYLKALAMVRNVAHQRGERVCRFTTLVADLVGLPEDTSRTPPRDDPAYYYRPWKTMLVRTVADGGTGLYVRGDHAATLPALWTALREPGAPPAPEERR